MDQTQPVRTASQTHLDHGEKSGCRQIAIPPTDVVEPGFCRCKIGRQGRFESIESQQSACSRCSNEVKLKLMMRRREVGVVRLATGTKRSLPTSKVLLLVQ